MVVGAKAARLQQVLPGQLLEFGEAAALAATAAAATTTTTGCSQGESTPVRGRAHRGSAGTSEKGPEDEKSGLPAGARLVTFPLEPKPRAAAATTSWIAENWVS